MQQQSKQKNHAVVETPFLQGADVFERCAVLWVLGGKDGVHKRHLAGDSERAMLNAVELVLNGLL